MPSAASVGTGASGANNTSQRAQRPPARGNTVPVVSLAGVVRHFGRFAALRGITAEFPVPNSAPTAPVAGPAAGGLFLILGENGAGKSTLLRIMAGLLKPTRGSVSLLGESDLRAVAARVGYMGHAPLLYDELSAMENLRYFAALYGIDRRNGADARCQTAIHMVGLDPQLKRTVGQYSQGMRQRISLARAIVHDPELLLLDEPFSNVDVQSAREMARLLGEMRAKGKTIFVVTHQPVVLEAVVDESLLLSAGLLAARERGLPEYMKFPFGQPADGLENRRAERLEKEAGHEGRCPSCSEGVEL